MLHRFCLITLLAAWCFMPANQAFAGTVEITVPNVAVTAGKLRLFLCTAKEFLREDCIIYKLVPARQGGMIITIKKVPAGEYAVQAYHDENGNEKIDWDFLGLLPAEAYGFSKLGRLYAEPDFADAAFSVRKKGTTPVTVTLNYP